MINITGHTGLTGLLGSPVAHSVSPLMHNEAFRYLGLDYVYLCFDVTEETLPQAVEGLKACGIKGFNLTMPNKNKIVELLDELSPTAQLIGAVNTVRNDNGKLKGFNTDGYGFTHSARDAGCDVKGRTITVMGVGGAGMAICGQSALEGAKKIHVFYKSFKSMTIDFIYQRHISGCNKVSDKVTSQERTVQSLNNSCLVSHGKLKRIFIYEEKKTVLFSFHMALM